MKSVFNSIVIAMLSLAPLSSNAAPPRVLEDAREVSPAMLTLPSALGGTVAIQGCSTCKRITLTLANTARFYIGRTEVNFVDLQRQLRQNPNGAVLVVSPKGQNIVTRIKASDASAQ